MNQGAKMMFGNNLKSKQLGMQAGQLSIKPNPIMSLPNSNANSLAQTSNLQPIAEYSNQSGAAKNGQAGA